MRRERKYDDSAQYLTHAVAGWSGLAEIVVGRQHRWAWLRCQVLQGQLVPVRRARTGFTSLMVGSLDHAANL
eukprot:1615080-Amphidinium_carterae.1